MPGSLEWKLWGRRNAPPVSGAQGPIPEQSLISLKGEKGPQQPLRLRKPIAEPTPTGCLGSSWAVSPEGPCPTPSSCRIQTFVPRRTGPLNVTLSQVSLCSGFPK